MYQRALNGDPRHYNAWWGLGNIYHRQEEHDNAKYHFVKALEVNKSNSVLRCYLGMVLDSLKNPLMALDNFDKASQCEPQNGMAYFQKALVLISLERYEEALDELKQVRCLAPKEASVHFQLGKVYMKLQKDRKALHHFNIAMDLNRDSKDYHTIKTHIEKLHIRGIRDADSSENVPILASAVPSTARSTATVERRSTVQGQIAAQVFEGLPRPIYAASVPAMSATTAGITTHLYGLSPLAHGSRPSPTAEVTMLSPQTPTAQVARGATGTSGGLWSAGPGSSARGYPGHARGAGRGGTPPSWAGTPAPTAGTTLPPGGAFRF